MCRTDSTGVYGEELKLMVVRLASDTIHNTLFMVLVSGYYIKLQHVLDHIWQPYVDVNGKTVELSTQVYYTNIMNAVCSFYNLKEHPTDLAGVFQDHMDPSVQKSFHVHYPNLGVTCLHNAITQHSILMDMLNALIKAENNLTNICNIMRIEQRSGEQFAMGQAMPSVEKKTLWRYANDTTRISQDSGCTSEVQNKMIIMGCQISSCHVPVVRSFFIL